MFYNIRNDYDNYKYLIDSLQMEEKGLPNPRFSEFTEVLNQQGNPIGFTIQNSTFTFKYDSLGGWYDEEGRYYNADGIQQPDEEDRDDLEDDEEGQSESDDELIDQFQDMLRRQEQGYVKPLQKKVQEEVKSSPQPPVQEKNILLSEYQELLIKYLKKQHLKENLPSELFIYFKQKAKYFEQIIPQVQKVQSTDGKNKHIEQIMKKIAQKRKQLITSENWLAQPEVFLDFSGQSQKAGEYERYWYGRIKTTAQKYLQFLKHITQSEIFYLLQNKTYYALKSKFYHKKSQEEIKKRIQEFSSSIQKLNQNQSIVIKLDYLPQNFPLSTVYDLVQYVNGNTEEIQAVSIVDQQAAQLTVLKNNALKLINLQAYNHDKGEYIQVTIDLQKIKESVLKLPIAKRFYSISIQGPYKLHERELNDTLGLKGQTAQLAKHSTQKQQSAHKIRFVLGSLSALKKVLMFRGESLNPIHVHCQVPK